MKYILLTRKLLVVVLVLTGNNIFSQNLTIPVLPAGDSIIVVSSVTINIPFTNNPARLAKQHTITGTNFSNVVSDDPETPAVNDSTFTVVVMQPIPIKLSKISAFLKNRGIQVEWTVQQEINVDKYEVERSQDGRHFAYIGAVLSNTNSNIPIIYDFFDANPFDGLNFYRIKIIDKSGEITYSPVVKISTKAQETQVTIYPNPVPNTTVRFSVNNLKKGDYTISVFNKMGQEVIRKTLHHIGGSAVEDIILPETLAAGIFEIRLVGEGISIAKKLVKN